VEEELAPNKEKAKTIINDSFDSRLSQFFVAEIDEEIIAFICWDIYEFLEGDKVNLEIAYVAVDEDHQSRGIGEELVNQTLRLSQEILTDDEVYSVFAWADPEAVGFYKKAFSMKPECRIPDFFGEGEDAIFMRRVI
ncbi:MAG: GNAT family N-acetyltransferase, partial [Gammaproteobacteria bacterium]|nr:GNAT family N-acetyltransferase [Gammaproteobacteria bacterium]